MNKTNLIIFVLLGLLVGLGVSIYFQNNQISEQVPLDVQPTLPEEPVKNAIVHYPVPESSTNPVTPPPKQSGEKPPSVTSQPEDIPPAVEVNNKNAQQALIKLFNGQLAIKLLHLENFIQKFVVTIDNLPEKQLPRAHLPIKAPGGKFLVAGTAEAPQCSSRNYKRYDKYIRLLESINQDLATKFYTYFYPLFQSAHEQLGYKNAYFNDRFVYVINHLLATPNPPDPILLAQPGVLFTYADPNLEKLSAGQKSLLRLGHEQRTKVLKILESYRDKLTNLHP